MRLAFHRNALAGAIAAGMLAACVGHTGSFVPPQSGVPAIAVAPQAVPPACKGQTTTSQYGKLTQTLSTKGGQLCIPAFNGFGGTIKYPAVKPSVKMTLTSSTSNYAKLPLLGKGKVLFFLQLAISGATTFSSSGLTGGGLTSQKIDNGNPYTAFGQATIGGFKVALPPCYTIATTGKYGGVIGGLGSLLKGQAVPAAAKGFIEIYPGKQTTNHC